MWMSLVNLSITIGLFVLVGGSGAVSGSQCCSNPPTLNSSSGEGSVIEIGGLKAYASGSCDSKLAVVLVSDIYGYEAPNLRMIADKVAAAGFYALVPDFFYGDSYVPGNPDRPISEWLKDHGTDKGFEDAKPVIAALREKGVSAVGAAGFCWGGKVVAELANSPHIQAAVLLHPSRVTVDDFEDIKAPIAVLVAEHDNGTPPALLKQIKEILLTKHVKGYVKVFPGASHGWTLRYNSEDKEAVKRAKEAHRDMLAWFIKQTK